MWLLATRGRPKLAQEAVDNFVQHGLSDHLPVVVYVDGDSYPDLKVPESWRVIEHPERRRIGPPMNDMARLFPNERTYGWLADDLRVVTPDAFDRLEAAAFPQYLAYTNDLCYASVHHEDELETGYNISGALCWGGELVRRVGWWAPPFVEQAMVDVIWCRIVSARDPGLHRYLKDVIVEHRNWRTGRRERDEVDEVPVLKPKNSPHWVDGWDIYPDHMKRDIEVAENWFHSDAFQAAVKRAHCDPHKKKVGPTRFDETVEER
jgi:hypothetical protein